MRVRLTDRLTLRQLRYTLVIALGLGLLLSAVQVARDYSQHVDSTMASADRMLDAFHYAAVQAAYTLDSDLAGDVVRGLVADGPIISARIISDLGDRLAGIHVGEQIETTPVAFLFGQPVVQRRELTKTQPGGRQETIGFLEVEISAVRTSGPFLERVALNLLSVLIETVVLAGVLALIYLRTTTRPITTIVSRLQAAEDEGTLVKDLPVPRGHDKDEIGFLVKAFNGLLRSVETELRARRQAEDDLRKANDVLEIRVEERTAHLNQEIAERRAIEEALRQSEERFRDLAEVSSDWFWETDEHGRFTLVSDRFFGVSGLSRHQIIGRTVGDLLVSTIIADISDGWDVLQNMMEQRSPLVRYDMTLRGNDGRMIFARMDGKPVFDITGQFIGYRGTGRDVTQRKIVEARLDEARSEAERANAAKSHFLANMSHELRTPMNAILGFAQLLRAAPGQGLTQTQKSYVQHILDAGDHLLRLINEILDLARIEAGRIELSIESVDIVDLVRECSDMLDPLAAGQDITVTIENHDGPLHVMADRSRLKQILLNLGSNAIKYNRQGGSVRIGFGTSPTPGLQRILVCDTGIGIPQDMLRKVFEPFNRIGADRTAIEGTGIGLTVTRQLVEHMNGAIGVESTVGEGSTFWFDLPVSNPLPKPKDLDSQRTQPQDGELPHPPLRVLYVEDNPANRDLMRDVMDLRPNVTLVMAENGKTGLSMALSENPDLILLDMNLPDIDGLKIARQLRTDLQMRDTPIVAVSAGAMARDIERARSVGIDDYICKPFDVSEMLSLLDTVATGQYTPGSLRQSGSDASLGTTGL